MVRPHAYDRYSVDDFPMGNNAIVAVIAYTVCNLFLSHARNRARCYKSHSHAPTPQGYDMEDAMIINKGALERGFMHGRVLATKLLDLTNNRSAAAHLTKRFGTVAAVCGVMVARVARGHVRPTRRMRRPSLWAAISGLRPVRFSPLPPPFPSFPRIGARGPAACVRLYRRRRPPQCWGAHQRGRPPVLCVRHYDRQGQH